MNRPGQPASSRRRRSLALVAVAAAALLALSPTGGPATAAGGTAAPAGSPELSVPTLAALDAEAEPVLYRAVNINGPAIAAGGIVFEAGTAAGFTAGPRSFCNQSVPLVPGTDEATATMLRCSVWGSGSPGAQLAMSGMPAGTYQVALYVWEDNWSQRFNVAMEGAVVASGVVSGPAGTWQLVGPFEVTVADGTLNIVSNGGSANMSGLVVYAGAGTPPPPTNQPPTVTSPGPQSSIAGTAIAPLQISASDPDAGQALTFTEEGLPDGLALNPSTGVVSGTPTTAGESSVTVTATDSGSPALAASATFAWTIAAPDPGPEPDPDPDPDPEPEPGVYRAVNINGPAIVVGDVPFEAGTAANFTAGPKSFCKQTVPLVPATDEATATMVRCSAWGSGNPGTQVTMTAVPAGTYEVSLYTWEDNSSATYGVRINGAVVASGVVSGSAGAWRVLGPYEVTVSDGTLAVVTSGGSANLSGIVVGSEGTPPPPPPTNRPPVVTTPGAQSSTVGAAIAPLQITASDPDAGQTLTFAATGLPAGLALSQATGVVSGTPTTAGTSSVTVTVTDNGSPAASASTTFSWAVTTGGGGGPTTFDPTKVVDSFVAGGNWTKSLSADWLPDGTMLVLTEAGRVYQVDPATGGQTLVLDITAKVFSGGESGTLDVLVDTAGTGFYLYYTVANSDRLRLSHFTLGSSAEQVIWENPGLGYNADHAVHLGGSLNIGPDGKLYLTIGDRYEGRSQDLTNVFGKVLRMNLDGSVPTDNPFYDGAGPNVDEIWAYGFRNPYRANFDEATGLFWVGDVGGNVDTQAYEEVNIVQAGGNYGWPMCEGPVGGPKNGPLCPAGVTGPVHYYSHAVGAGCCQNRAIIGGEIYRASAFPLAGRYVYVDYAVDRFFWVGLGADGRTEAASGLLAQIASGVPVWLGVGPDGAIYWLSLGFGGGGQLRKLTYTGAVGSPPVITTASAAPTTGAAPLTVAFTGAANDPDGTPVTYAWDFGDGATSTAASPSHTYAANGTYTARLVVSSGGESVSSDLVTIVVGTPPTATITSPADGTTFVAGDTIAITGTGTDPETGALPGSALSWDVQFLHNEHAHPVTSGSGSSIVLDVPTDGHDFTGNTRYLVRLTATDPEGVTGTAEIVLWPTKTSVAISSNSATSVTVNGITQTLPHAIDALVGFEYALGVPESRCAGGRTWTFQSWSDGGARTHTVVAAPGMSLVATYADTGACATSGGLMVSAVSSRAGAVPLEGVTLTPGTPAYIFFEFVKRPAKVEFWLDQPVTAPPSHVEAGAPYDFAGGAQSSANPFDPGSVSPGPHTITTRVTRTDGTTEVFATTFSVSGG